MHNLYYATKNILDYTVHIASNQRGLVAVGLEESQEDFIGELKKDFSNSRIVYNEEKNHLPIQQITEYFQGTRRQFDLSLDIMGTSFQRRVWEALLTIPYGKVVAYKDIAIEIGNAKAGRAVGLANKKNKIPIIIPCHRVIGVNGSLVGYDGGLDLKKKLLALEGVKIVKEKVGI
ncbi:methylated-DNA--[protein]-cysteine S-methyltransferase [Natronincola ferrireducens]|uniref:Methylated-DNA--protein-cysteine methyltransferase n=1 Tax=Natronincola ferrireducens TaxID=393762 RepID=A0A1G9E043_9FIRM|nr:methylated-DNA--[protein]-cysteine S-methyltransferase [Natronincola ferrireducens]SDK69507.1 methylated-DNA-[protein]-cysteine S-methyltransferase [Natronincola ferrireducens]